ncbi:MAG: hypothetical protein CL677_06670, partial [Bdellovibrionaceae bacterium]|nr:hypothetical protein [Pseudobdellovibrionaceae bacterium]
PVTIRIYSGSLYVACRSENRVKKWDLATDLATTVYGDGGDDVSGENADALTSGARRPMGLHVDATGIYVTHSDNNRIRYVNTTGATVTFWGDVSVGAGNVRTIIGTGSTGYQTNGKPTTLNTGDPEGVYHINNRIYYTFRDRDKIALANNTGADITIGARTIANNEAGYLNAAGTSSGYNGTNVDLDIAQLNEPYNIFPDVSDSDVLYIADYNNRRIRSIDVGDAKMYDILGSGTSRYGFLGDVDKPSIDHLFNQLGGLAYESSSRTLFFVDQNNYRVRQMTPYGEISTAVGRGNGNPEIENDVPSNAFTRVQYSGDNYMNGAALLSDGSLIQLNTRGHSFRIWNRTISNKTYFGTFILSDRISNVAGDPLGATNGPGDGPDGPALSHEFNYPTDVAVYNDSGNDVIFIADQQNHCIKQLDNTGNVTSVLGTCGSSGNSGNNNVAEGSVQFNRPHGLAVDSIGNLIITDSWNSKVRYWNRTGSPVMVGNLTVNANSVSTIACNSGTSGSPSEGIFATSARCYRPLGVDVNEDYICFANTWDHNVRCIDLSDGRISTVSGNLEATRRAGSPYGLEQEGITGTSATHYYPGDVLFDENGDLFIGDRANHVVRKLKLSSD